MGGGGWRGDFPPQGWHPSPQPVSGQRSVRARVYGSVTVSVCECVCTSPWPTTTTPLHRYEPVSRAAVKENNSELCVLRLFRRERV